MRNTTILLLLLFVSCPLMAQNTNSSNELLKQGVSKRKAKKAAAAKEDRTLYWLGKVPVKDGEVVFEKTFDVPGKSKDQICDAVSAFVSRLIEESGHTEVSQMAVNDREQGVVMGSMGETMYFKRAKWESDFTNFYYQIKADCSDGKCAVAIKNIQYRYEEGHEVKGEYLKAEDWITDEAAFNKDKTKILKEPFKFRRGTIKRINEILGNMEKAL